MKILFGITGVLSFIALANLPYEFYVSFRWLVAVAAVALGVVAHRAGATVWYLLAIPAFVLWFPLFGIEMDKSVWIIFNVLAGIGFIAAANSKQLFRTGRD
tara:strand:- start:221 stop:523 length:303 start_codon:yes stop_codon:yes gene_type:complete